MPENAGPQQAVEDERARTLYWSALVQLKADCEYTVRYRDSLARLLTWFDIGRAVVSVGALGSWVAGLGYPELWGGIIVVSQVAEAVFAKLPLTARQRGVAGFCTALDAIFIDALFEWEDIQSDRHDARETTRRWHMLLRVRHEAELKHLPNGLPVRRKMFDLAEQAAAAYFEAGYRTARRP